MHFDEFFSLHESFVAPYHLLHCRFQEKLQILGLWQGKPGFHGIQKPLILPVFMQVQILQGLHWLIVVCEFNFWNVCR